MLVYLDSCCLNRPYDDQSQTRIQLESAVILAIMEQVLLGRLNLASTSVLQYEIQNIADSTRKNGILHFLNYSSLHQILTTKIQQRGVVLHNLGFKQLDALHLSSAEAMKADVFLTTDDQILRRSIQHSALLSIPVLYPVQFSTNQNL
jgi:hypothetical protein